MNFNLYTRQGVHILSVNNLLNEFENRKILDAVEPHFHEGANRFVLDLTNMEFMNSIGLNFLIALLKKSEMTGSEIVLANQSKKILKLLEITKLRSMFVIEDSVEGAVQIL